MDGSSAAEAVTGWWCSAAPAIAGTCTADRSAASGLGGSGSGRRRAGTRGRFGVERSTENASVGFADASVSEKA